MCVGAFLLALASFFSISWEIPRVNPFLWKLISYSDFAKYENLDRESEKVLPLMSLLRNVSKASSRRSSARGMTNLSTAPKPLGGFSEQAEETPQLVTNRVVF